MPLIICIFLFLGTPIVAFGPQTGRSANKDVETDTIQTDASKIPRSSDFDPNILITSDADFATQATAKGWSGDGSPCHPYLIRDLTIQALTTHGIEIRGTTVHFIIENVTVLAGTYLDKFGFFFDYVTNAKLRNNTASGNDRGFYLYGSNLTLIENVATQNSGPGFMISGNNHTLINNSASLNDAYSIGNGFELSGNNHTLLGNTATGNSGHGFYITSAQGYNLTGNTATENHYNGFDLQGHNHTLVGNRATGNAMGFSVQGDYSDETGNIATGSRYQGFYFSGKNHTVCNNSALENGYQGILLSGDNHTLMRNIVTGNGWSGFHLHNALDCNLTGNTLAMNGYGPTAMASSHHGIYLQSSFFNKISRNAIANNYAGAIREEDSLSNEFSDNYLGQPPHVLTSDAGERDADGMFWLNWTDLGIADTYSLYLDGELLVAGLTNDSYRITGFATGTFEFDLELIAQYWRLNSSVSVVVDFNPHPFNLSSNAGNPDEDGVFKLTWTTPGNALNFTIFKDGGVVEEGLTNSSYEVRGLGTNEYAFQVRAFNNYGSTDSNTLEVVVNLGEDCSSWTKYAREFALLAGTNAVEVRDDAGILRLVINATLVRPTKMTIEELKLRCMGIEGLPTVGYAFQVTFADPKALDAYTTEFYYDLAEFPSGATAEGLALFQSALKERKQSAKAKDWELVGNPQRDPANRLLRATLDPKSTYFALVHETSGAATLDVPGPVMWVGVMALAAWVFLIRRTRVKHH